MEKINLTNEKIVESAGHSSKGNQPKWVLNNKWYKADHMGYEALAEIVISRLLEKSNITNFVKYYPVEISYNDRTLNGCYSLNFLKKGHELIPLERLHRAYCGIGLHEKLSKIQSVEDRITYTVSFVEQRTNLTDFGSYLTAMIEIDSFFLNEDRHTNNIAVIRNPETNEYFLCPYFDQGLSLLSDTDGFWFGEEVEKHIMRVSAKPFGSLNVQLSAIQNIYGNKLKFNFKSDDIETILNKFKGMYSDKILNRVKKVIEIQCEKYSSVFFEK